MGSSISKHYERLEDYEHFLKDLGIEERRDDFYKHEKDILSNLGFESKWDYYDSQRKIEQRDKKITEILK